MEEDDDIVASCDVCCRKYKDDFEADNDLTYCEECSMEVCGLTPCYCECPVGSSKTARPGTLFTGPVILGNVTIHNSTGFDGLYTVYKDNKPHHQIKEPEYA